MQVLRPAARPVQAVENQALHLEPGLDAPHRPTSRRRAAIYRVHEPPEPQAVQLLLAKLTDLEIPTPPVPDVDSMAPADAARVAAEAS